MKILVIGGGIAGAAVCHALGEHDVVLLDRESIGAKSPPAALLHAIPGRSFDREPIEWQAFEVAMNWLRGSTTPMVEATMVRPLTGRGGERLRSSYERVADDFPSWFEHQYVEAPRPQIEYTPAFSVDMRALAREWASEATFAQLEVLELDPENRCVRTEDESMSYDKLIVTTGAEELVELPPMRIYEGELLMSSDTSLDHMISAGGHAAPMAEGGVSVGATVYEEGKDVDVGHEIGRLLERVGKWVELPDRESFEIWHGSRATVADRFPICVEFAKNGLALNSLGSRGLYWAAYLAECVAGWLDGEELPARFSPERLESSGLSH